MDNCQVIGGACCKRKYLNSCMHPVLSCPCRLYTNCFDLKLARLCIKTYQHSRTLSKDEVSNLTNRCCAVLCCAVRAVLCCAVLCCSTLQSLVVKSWYGVLNQACPCSGAGQTAGYGVMMRVMSQNLASALRVLVPWAANPGTPLLHRLQSFVPRLYSPCRNFQDGCPMLFHTTSTRLNTRCFML